MSQGFLDWWVKRGRFVLVGMGIGLIVLGGLWMLSNPRNKASDVEFYSVQENSKETTSLIIDIRGAVENPGVFKLEPDSRLQDAVTKAGGYTDKADMDWVEKNLNMARKLSDGEKIYIPTREEGHLRGVSLPDSSDGVLGQSQQFVNINAATQAELETLVGIGPAFAQRIIDYREENNGFKSIEEIQAVSGIGEKTFEKIKDQISI